MGRLFDRICHIATLRQAWQRIEQKGSRGGIDGIGIDEFAQKAEQHLEDLSEALQEGRYAPEPTERIYTPKFNASGELRPLSLPTLKDKIVQQATRMTIEPLFERRFLDCSYAYRHRMGPMKAIACVTRYVTEEKRQWAVVGDLDNFFDSLNHQRLLVEVKKVIYEPEILSLLRMWIKIGVVDPRGEYHDANQGIAQGSIISPLLSNIYAHSLDQEMLARRTAYVRYADNLIMLCTTREEAEAKLTVLDEFIREELKLRLNPETRPVRSLEGGFTFLGISFKGDIRSLSREKFEKIARKINWQTNWNRPQQLNHIVEELTETVAGAVRYYGFLNPVRDFQALDDHLLRRIEGLCRARSRRGEVVKKADLIEILKPLPFFSAMQCADAERLRSQLASRVFSNARRTDPGKDQVSSAGVNEPPSWGSDEPAKTMVDSAIPARVDLQECADPSSAMTSRAASPKAPLEESYRKDTKGMESQDRSSQLDSAPEPQESRGSDRMGRATDSAVIEHTLRTEHPLDESADRKIESKKRHYVRRSAVESDLVVQTHGVFIGHRGNRVFLRKDRKTIHSQPLIKVKSISIHSRGVSFSSDLIEACARMDVPVVFSSPTGQCYASLQAPVTCKPDVGLLQLHALQSGTALSWAKEFVIGKTKNQLNLLKFYLRHRKGLDDIYTAKVEEAERDFVDIWAKVKAVEVCAPVESSRNRLFALEGRAGAIYWGTVRLLIPEEITFPGRVTQGATDLVNSMLNFGYGILYPRVERALLAAGLNLQASLLHAPQEGKRTLAFDLIEPFRAPVVDRAVLSLLTRGRELSQTLEGRLTEGSIRMIIEAVSKRLGTLVPYGGEKITLEQVIRKQARLLAGSLRNEKRFKAFISRY